MAEPLTERQHEVLLEIREFIYEKGHSPSYGEIAKLIHVGSLATVHKLVHALELKGYISLVGGSGKKRNITLGTVGGVCCPKCKHHFEAVVGGSR
jgi:SOS-response transcriptional repressor LexA